MTTPPPQEPTRPSPPPESELPLWQPSGSAWGPPPTGGSYGQAPAYGQTPAYGQAPAYGPPPGGDFGYAGPGGTETKAIVALVLSIASFFVFPFVPAVAALLVAGAARRDIRASGGRRTGDGLVTAARVIAWINIVLCSLAFLAVTWLLVAVGSTGFSEGLGRVGS